MIAFLLALAQMAAITQVCDSYPSLSPDGRQLIFSSNRSGAAAIWITTVDGANPRMLFDGGALGSDPATAVWSPDGSRIAFAMRPSGSTDENESEIYIMRPDGTGVRRLTDAPGDDSHPHWSADGSRIFFNSARATPDLKADWSRQRIDIYSMAADGSDVRRHTDCRTVCTYPVPSPDGRRIAFRKVIDTPGLQWDLEPGHRNSESSWQPSTDRSPSMSATAAPMTAGRCGFRTGAGSYSPPIATRWRVPAKSMPCAPTGAE